MISSMTGFGRYELTENQNKYTVELKSVNHKYLDVGIKMPRKFNAFEGDIRNLLKKYATRGKIDIYISSESLSEGNQNLKFNEELAKEYFMYYKKIADAFELKQDISISSIARSPEVLTLEDADLDEEEIWKELKKACEEAFSRFKESRQKEGESLKNNILQKLDEMTVNVDYIESRLPEIITEFKTKLEARVFDLLSAGDIDEGRIAAEVTLFADKIAVDEELVRLRTHINSMRDILIKGGEIGRNLDFLAQEMNREANTTLSKSNDIAITNCGIELKTCIEKIREQVQNIE